MKLLRYALHLNTEKLEVKRFMFGLNGDIHAKVRILMPQTLHDIVQKALIAEEAIVSQGKSRTTVRPTIHSLGYCGFQRGSTFTKPRRPTCHQ
jgi:hypothetical protein